MSASQPKFPLFVYNPRRPAQLLNITGWWGRKADVIARNSRTAGTPTYDTTHAICTLVAEAVALAVEKATEGADK